MKRAAWRTLGECTCWGLLLSCGRPTEGSLPTKDALFEERDAPPAIVFDLEPREGHVCQPQATGRGCRTSSFQGTCGSYFSASHAEFERNLERHYLGLRAVGDRRRFPPDPPLFPEHRGRAFIGAGLTIVELNHLAALLGVATPTIIDEPPAEVARLVGLGDAFAAKAFRVSPALTQALSQIESAEHLNRVAQLWDESSQTAVGGLEHPGFGPNSWAECRLLLGRIVEVASDAASSQRELYLVQSLPRPTKRACGVHASCDGYACGYRLTETGDTAPVCHSGSDTCQTPLDCPAGALCAYDSEARHFSCVPEP